MKLKSLFVSLALLSSASGFAASVKNKPLSVDDLLLDSLKSTLGLDLKDHDVKIFAAAAAFLGAAAYSKLPPRSRRIYDNSKDKSSYIDISLPSREEISLITSNGPAVYWKGLNWVSKGENQAACVIMLYRLLGDALPANEKLYDHKLKKDQTSMVSQELYDQLKKALATKSDEKLRKVIVENGVYRSYGNNNYYYAEELLTD